MENRNRDKISQSDHSTSAGKVNKDTSSRIGQSKNDSNASFGNKTGRSENLNEPTRRTGESGIISPSKGSSGSGMNSSSGRDSGSSGMGSSSGRSGSSSGMSSSSGGVRRGSDREHVENDMGRSSGSSIDDSKKKTYR